MIGSDIRKYAERRGLHCDGGIAYGVVHGLHIALSGTAGAKVLAVYLCPPAEAGGRAAELERARQTLLDCDAREYRLWRQDPVTVEAGVATVTFADALGAMRRVARYIDEVLPRLDAPAGDRCAHCGAPLAGDGRRVLFEGRALPVHAACAGEMARRIQQAPKRPDRAVRGLLGALAGGLLGAVAWAAAYALGCVTSFAGLLIGFLANLLYGKCGGPDRWLRAAAVALAVIFGVAAGQFGGCTIVFARRYAADGGFDGTGLTRWQYVATLWDGLLLDDSAAILGRQYDRMASNLSAAERALLMPREAFIAQSGLPETAAERAALRADAIAGTLFGLVGGAGMIPALRRQRRRRAVKLLR